MYLYCNGIKYYGVTNTLKRFCDVLRSFKTIFDIQLIIIHNVIKTILLNLNYKWMSQYHAKILTECIFRPKL